MSKRRKSQKNIYYAIYILCFILVALIVILNVTPKKTSTNLISPKQTTQTQIQTKPKTTQTEQSKTTTASKTTENIISLICCAICQWQTPNLIKKKKRF